MLETATFFIDVSQACFTAFKQYKSIINSLKNIPDADRNPAFWTWIVQLPSALQEVMQSEYFQRYMEWKDSWIAVQNTQCENELKRISHMLAMCHEKIDAPFQNEEIVINPIKCVYSSDYHIINDQLIICLGELRVDSIIHEYAHHIIHPAIVQRKDEILHNTLEGMNVDCDEKSISIE